MRLNVQIGDTNSFGVQVVSGPYKIRNHNSWDFLCPFCKKTFIAPTTNFKEAKSCYDCRGLVKRKSSEDITWKNHYLMLKGRKHSKEKGLDITEKQFKEISSRNCFYCDSEPTPTKGHRDWSAYILTNGLDRIDPSMGYLYNNVVACCKWCNMAKLDRTVEEFYSWITKLSEHQNRMQHSTSTRTIVSLTE
jgi:hypothetical protein